jgi:LDH2 family malate/lactate/ureidoglycolate dehydrogenase
MSIDGPVHIQAESLKAFCIRVFERLGVLHEDAALTADVLAASDLRGIDSHGIAHLRRYVEDMDRGVILARPEIRTVAETRATATIDAGAGLGPPVSVRAMRRAIDKALDVGAGFVAVRNSNHFGIAGYYALLAVEHDCIGITTTNGRPLVVPTFGRRAMLGTNPIAVAAPAGNGRPFVLDMATSTVARGKLEIYGRLGKQMPLGWATDEKGAPATDPRQVMGSLAAGKEGGMLPLGGAGESTGGYKGYGLALLVDILSAVLPGAAYADTVYPRTVDGHPLPSAIGHFFGAWRVDAFRPADEFRAAMDDLQQRLRETPKAEGQERIYVHGDKEYEIAERRAREGIPLHPKVVTDLRRVAETVGIAYDLQVSRFLR